jgi:hypothetical protein
VRHLIPEFEAMKTVLAQGVVVAGDVPFLPCFQLKSGQSSYWEWLTAENCHQIRNAPDLQLPKIHPSYFKDGNDILPGNASLEWMSAHFGIPETGRKITSPYWYGPDHNSDERHVLGAWDIGVYELRLEQPVVEHVVRVDGEIAAYQWTPIYRVIDPLTLTGSLMFGPDRTWDGWREWGIGKGGTRDFNVRRGQTPLPGYATMLIPQKHAVPVPPSDEEDARAPRTLLWFQSAKALPLQNAGITHHTIKIPEITGIHHGFTISVFEVDLDHDGIADFVKWFPGNIDNFPRITMNGLISIVFVNIDGKWYRFETDYEELGC